MAFTHKIYENNKLVSEEVYKYCDEFLDKAYEFSKMLENDEFVLDYCICEDNTIEIVGVFSDVKQKIVFQGKESVIKSAYRDYLHPASQKWHQKYHHLHWL